MADTRAVPSLTAMFCDYLLERQMNSNAPDFDPLRATSAETADMLMGYRDGLVGRAAQGITSAAYDWGRKCGANDRNGVADDDQRAVAAALAHAAEIEAGRKR